jgi:hypothetical protein
MAIALPGPATLAARAQTTTLTPAQQKAEAAKEARQAAQQQAAQKRAEAAQNRTAAAQQAAQNKAAAAQNKTLAGTTAPNAATGAMTTTAATAASTARPATPATTTPATASRTNGMATTGAGTVGSGSLSWQTRVYSSTGCVHNGNSAVCTFTFANQGNEATLVAGAELSGIQLVDDAHVPHKADAAHFLDKYGTQQPRLLVQPGDTGTYVLTFSNVNAQVTTGDFHLRQQIVGGVTFSAAAATTGAAPATTAPAKAPAK